MATALTIWILVAHLAFQDGHMETLTAAREWDTKAACEADASELLTQLPAMPSGTVVSAQCVETEVGELAPSGGA